MPMSRVVLAACAVLLTLAEASAQSDWKKEWEKTIEAAKKALAVALMILGVVFISTLRSVPLVIADKNLTSLALLFGIGCCFVVQSAPVLKHALVVEPAGM